jgi:CelD/BcsL family acetyltransferase involved in cellulose biosynthesis
MARRTRRELQRGSSGLKGGDGSTIEVACAPELLTPEWDALADRLRAAPFLRPGWIAAWWAAFGKGTLELFVRRRGGELVGVLPLYRCRGLLLSPTNWHTPRFGLLAEPQDSSRFVEQILLASGGARRISLAFVDSNREELLTWRFAAEAHRFRVLTRTLVRSVAVEIDGDWDAYERALSRNLRGNLRKSLRRLGAAGKVSFESLDGREGLDSLLTEGFGIESSGWKGARGTAIAATPETERFYRALAVWAAERGWLRLAFLRLDGRALAFELSLEENGVYYALKSGFDPAYRAFSPGKLLIHWTLEHAFELGLSRYELAGVESYKLSWANTFRDLALFQAFPPSPAGLIDWAAFRYGRPVARWTLAAVREQVRVHALSRTHS